ncbi:unnamed protein product, partial [Penicillium palitans]
VEANVVIIAACIPTLKPILDLILRRLKPVPTSKGYSKQPWYVQHMAYDNQSSSRAQVAKTERPTTLCKKESQEGILNNLEQTQTRWTNEVYEEYEMQVPKPAFLN